MAEPGDGATVEAIAVHSRDRRTFLWFVVGLLIGLPILRMHGNVLTDADSSRLLANVLHIRRHGVGYLADTQEVLVPHAVYWLTSLVGGIGVARWVPLLSYMVLSGVVAAIGYQVTRHPAGGLAAPLALLTFVPLLDQQRRLPLYALMLAAGYAGAFVVARLTDVANPRRLLLGAVLGAALLVLSAESHATGQLFLFAPLLLLPVGVWRARLRVTAFVYGAMAVLLLPRLVINLSERGTAKLRSNYDYYLIRNGYLDLINRDFWGYPVNVGLRTYVGDFTDMLRVEFRLYVVPVLLVALVGLVLAPWRVRLVTLLSCALVLAGILQVRPSPFPRYILPLAPGAAVLAAFAVARLWQRPAVALRAMAAAGAVMLAVCGTWGLVRAKHGAVREDARIERGAWREIATRIDDGRAVAGVRSPQIMYVRDDVETYGPLFWTEDEYVTYLTWPSDEEVLALLRKYGIGWVFLTGDGQPERGTYGGSYEVDYPAAWVEPTYGVRPRQPEMIARSPSFCRVVGAGEFELYRVGSCDAGAG